MLQPVQNELTHRRPDLREDNLHFRSGTVPVTVMVTAQRRKTPMGDLVLRGLIGGKDIEVVFPGQRQLAAQPLLERLQARLQSARYERGSAADGKNLPEVRQELKVDGAWRVRLMNEQNAKPDRRFQLVAARWRYRGADGIEHVFGHMPNA